MSKIYSKKWISSLIVSQWSEYFLENRNSYLKPPYQQGKMQFWNPCRNVLNRNPNISFSRLDDDEKTQVFWKKFFPKKSSTDYVKCSYDNPAE